MKKLSHETLLSRKTDITRKIKMIYYFIFRFLLQIIKRSEMFSTYFQMRNLSALINRISKIRLLSTLFLSRSQREWKRCLVDVQSLEAFSYPKTFYFTKHIKILQ
jgi:hypothetical protein